jgi:hypothetical protein
MEDIKRLVEGAFDMDTLGIKDKVRSAGLSKFYKKDQSDWSPEEHEIDEKMVVTMIPATATVPQHYTCKIPWKNGKEPDLKNNIEQILKRQHQICYSGYLEKKGTSIEEIDKYFQDMLNKGYIEEVKDPEDIKRAKSQGICWFPVVHKNRDTTKVRVVFDAASANKEGKSVNSEVEKTPNRLNDLFKILLRFRQYEFALQADISEMFLRICLEPEDRQFLRFYWNGKIWKFVSIAFGVRCCPNVSQKVITTHVDSVKDQYPDAAKVVIDETYMDDSITSKQTEEMLIKIANQLIPLMRGINMFIIKFCSNSKMLVNSLDPKLLSKKVTLSEKETLFEESKVLGMS